MAKIDDIDKQILAFLHEDAFLSNKEMAAMLGVSVQGVRNYRYRLRKKFNLPEDGDIEDIINEI